MCWATSVLRKMKTSFYVYEKVTYGVFVWPYGFQETRDHGVVLLGGRRLQCATLGNVKSNTDIRILKKRGK